MLHVWVHIRFEQLLRNKKGCTCEVKSSEWNKVLDVVMSQFDHNQTDQSPAESKKKRKKKTVRLHSETPAQKKKKVISKQEKIEPTCRSWSPNAPSSVCLRGRHHRHRRHPQRHFRLNHTKHCSPKAGGKAERKRGIKVRGKKIILVLYNTVRHTNRLSV